MSVLFIAAGGLEWASSRMRAHWPAQCMDADVMLIDEAQRDGYPEGYEAVIFQKMVNIEAVAAYRDMGVPVWWDMCDPLWWWQPGQARRIAEAVDGVVMSNEALRKDYERWMESDGIEDKPPVFTIPDRLELSHFEEHRRREHDDGDPVRFVWYGMANNRVSLYSAIANMERLAANGYDIELTIMDERPDAPFKVTNYFPIYHIEWSLEQEVQVIAAHDIALLPPYPGAWGVVKSNNKFLTAYASGVVPAKGSSYENLCSLADGRELRQEWADDGWNNYVKEHFDVRQTAVEWDELLMTTSAGRSE